MFVEERVHSQSPNRLLTHEPAPVTHLPAQRHRRKSPTGWGVGVFLSSDGREARHAWSVNPKPAAKGGLAGALFTLPQSRRLARSRHSAKAAKKEETPFPADADYVARGMTGGVIGINL